MLIPVLLAAGAWADEFALLQAEIAASRTWPSVRLEREAVRKDALILAGDRTPADVVYRRTDALVKCLQGLPNAPNLEAEVTALQALRPADGADDAVQRKSFAALVALRRIIAFKNPLLDFDRIVFLKHNKQARGARHMVDQFFGFNAEKAGGLYVLENPFGDKPTVKSLLADARVCNGRFRGRLLENQGSFIALDLDWDAQTLLFAFTEAEHTLPPGVTCDTNYWTEADASREPQHRFYHFRDETCYHLFSVRADGSGLRQLTDGPVNDFDGCFLPDRRVAFISTRTGGQLRCGLRPDPTYTLHAMRQDGSDLVQLSFHDTNEWHPSVDNSGMLVYTRWDYVDRDSDVAHHIWRCYPDGRDPRSFHGNYPDRREMRPWMELSVRAIPGSQKYVAVAAPHHGEAYGSLVLLDMRARDDRACGQIRRLTPDVPFPESESAPGVPHVKGRHAPNAEVFGTPWPLSEDFYLAVHDAGRKNYGIYLLDSFGNRELLYSDRALACLDPIPLKPRPRPPVLPVQTLRAPFHSRPGLEPSMGTVMVMNVYESDQCWPEGVQVKNVRVIALFPKDNSVADEPNIGSASQSLCRGVLGTAPVEADGSASFLVPAGVGVYFQALDEKGLAVHTMRSATYLHPGETLTCIGCHETKKISSGTADGRQPLAMRRKPSVITQEATGSFPLTFPRLVQPVLNAKCMGCHDENRAKGAPSLHGDRFGTYGWSEAFHALRSRAWGMSGGNGVALKERQYSIPGMDGARVSRLYQMLMRGHHGVQLTTDEMRRLSLWMDCNSNFYGAYYDIEKQARGEIVKPRHGIPAWTSFEKLVR